MKGMTLVELAIVIMILAIMAAIVVIKYVDLEDASFRAQRDGNAASVRAAVSLYYAQTATNNTPSFPTSIVAGLFLDNRIPPASSGAYTWSYDSAAGTVNTN